LSNGAIEDILQFIKMYKVTKLGLLKGTPINPYPEVRQDSSEYVEVYVRGMAIECVAVEN